MNGLTKIRPRWWVGLTSGFFLISLSVGIRMAKDELVILNRLEANLREIQGLAFQTEAQMSQLADALEGEAQDPRLLFATEQTKEKIVWENLQTSDLPEGFQHQKISMLINGLDPDALEGVLTRVENVQPAWRVTSIQLETRTGSLYGSLQLEALDKSPLEL